MRLLTSREETYGTGQVPAVVVNRPCNELFAPHPKQTTEGSVACPLDTIPLHPSNYRSLSILLEQVILVVPARRCYCTAVHEYCAARIACLLSWFVIILSTPTHAQVLSETSAHATPSQFTACFKLWSSHVCSRMHVILVSIICGPNNKNAEMTVFRSFLVPWSCMRLLLKLLSWSTKQTKSSGRGNIP